jgi:hypothetical protein
VDTAAGAFAHRVETRERRRAVEVADHASHQVVGGRGDRDRRGARVEARGAAGGEDAGEALLGNRSQVEDDMIGVVGIHAIEDRRRDLISRGELIGEPPPRRIE